MTTTHFTPGEKQQRYRSRLSRQGLRPVQIWVPDTGAPNFIKECHRQANAVAQAADETAVQDFLGAITDWDKT